MIRDSFNLLTPPGLSATFRFRYSFICQGTSTRRQRVKCLAQGHNKRTCRPISTL